MNNSKQIIVVEQREVAFHGDAIMAVLAEGGEVYVPIRPICEALGVQWAAQRKRINRDAVLQDELINISVSVTDTQGQTQNRAISCLPLKFLNGWLFGINADRVKPNVRDRLIRYQRECYEVLWQAFQKQEVVGAPTIEGINVDELLRTGQDPEAQAYRMALAVANMARQQIILRYQLQEQQQQLDNHDLQLGVHGERLDKIEIALGGDTIRYLSDAQASKLSQAVKVIALELGKRSGRNEFGGVYGELYRRFDITGYKMLPANKFDDAMQFLKDWYESLTNIEVPF